MGAKSKATRPTTGRLGPSRLASGRKSQRRRRLMGPRRTGYATRLRTRRWIRLFVFVPYSGVLLRAGRSAATCWLRRSARAGRGPRDGSAAAGPRARTPPDGSERLGRPPSGAGDASRTRHPGGLARRFAIGGQRRVRARTGTRSGGNWLALLLRCPCACT